jgi:hypothetical protein
VDILFKKEYSFLVILSLLICMLAISSVTAADDAMNEDLTADEVSIDEVDTDASISDNVLKSENVEEIITDNEIEDNSKETLVNVEDVVETPEESLACVEDVVETPEESLISAENEEFLSLDSPSFDSYNVNVDDVTAYVGEEISIPINIIPNPSTYYKYDFWLNITDSDGNELCSYDVWNTSEENYRLYTISEYLDIGTYTIKLINYEDKELMDTATLTVIEHPIQNATITISQSGSYYNEKYVTVKVIDRDTNSVIKNTAVT